MIHFSGVTSEVDQQATVMFVPLTEVSSHWTAKLANNWDEEYPPSSPELILQRAALVTGTDFNGGYRCASPSTVLFREYEAEFGFKNFSIKSSTLHSTNSDTFPQKPGLDVLLKELLPIGTVRYMSGC